MDLEMFMNLIVYILALFGLILVLFLFVKFVLWCLMCDTDPVNDVERAKLQFKLNRIDQSKAKNGSKVNNKVQSQSYRKASEPFPEVAGNALRRSPEIERLNSENLSIHSIVVDPEEEELDSVKNYSSGAGGSEEEIFAINEIEKVIREAESPPVQYAEIDHDAKAKKACVKRTDSSLSGCVCPFCSKSGRVTAELVRASVQAYQDQQGHGSSDEDQVSIRVESEYSFDQEPEPESDVRDIQETIQDVKAQSSANETVKNAFREIDNALEEIDGVVLEMINENLSQSEASGYESLQRQESRPEVIQVIEKAPEIELEKRVEFRDDTEGKSEPEVEIESNGKMAPEVESDKPKVPEKPKHFIRRIGVKNQPQCVTYSQVVDQLKKRNSQIVNPPEVPESITS